MWNELHEKVPTVDRAVISQGSQSRCCGRSGDREHSQIIGEMTIYGRHDRLAQTHTMGWVGDLHSWPPTGTVPHIVPNCIGGN